MKLGTITTKIASLLVLAGIYFAGGKLGLALAFENVSVTLVWPPTGIALAAVLIAGWGVWPGIYLGAYCVNVTTTGDVPTSLAIAAGNTLEAVLGGYLIRQFASGLRVFEQPRGVFQFLALAGLGNMASATLGVLSLALAGEQFLPRDKIPETWLTWWIGDTIGGLLVTPPLVLWWREPRIQWHRRQVLLAAFMYGLLIGSAVVVFGDLLPLPKHNYPLAFVFLPMLIWIAFQFGRRQAATAMLVLAAIAIYGTLRHHGPFQGDTPQAALLILQTFLAITSVTTLLFTGLAHGLYRAKLELEQRVEERTGKLHQAHKRIGDLLETSPDAMVIVNRQGRIVRVNAQTERMFGFQRMELMGQPVEILIPARYRFPHQSHRDNFFTNPAIRPMGVGQDLLAFRKDGQEFPVEISLNPLATEEGPLVCAAIRDISLRIEIEKRLRQSERLAAIGEMITGLAHESRNALQRTHACLELLILKVEQRPELLALVQDIQKAQDYLVHMYEEVRSYAAPMKLRREKLNLNEVLQETWAHLEAERKGRTATLVKEPCPSIRDFRADPLALNQVFRNILENSLSVCVDPVILQVQWTEKLISGQVYVEITFRDNGPGFAPAIKDKVFEPFFTTKTRGTGLGLAIAKRIVEAHGGRIEIGRSGHPGAEIVLTFLKETS